MTEYKYALRKLLFSFTVYLWSVVKLYCH